MHGRKILSNPFEFRETALIGGVWQVRVETFRTLFAVLVAIPRPENDAFNDRHRRYRDDPLTRAMQFSRNGDGFSTPIDAHHFLPSSIIFNPDYNPLFWITRFLTLQNFEKKNFSWCERESSWFRDINHNLSLTVYFFNGTHSSVKIVRQIRFGTCYFLFESSEMIERYRVYRSFKRTSRIRIKNISQKSIF